MVRKSRAVKVLLTALGISLSVFCLLFYAKVGSTFEKPKKDEWSKYYKKDANFLEAELKKKPGNEDILEHLIIHYSRRGKNQEKLRYYTLEMVKFHPGNSSICFDTVTAFYIFPQFRDEVIDALEKQIPTHNEEAGLFWNLAQIYQRKAVPPFPKEASDKRKQGWFHWYGVPPETKIPTEIDCNLAAKAEEYYREAIRLSEGHDFYYSWYSGHLAGLLIAVGRESKAIPIYEKAIKNTKKKYRSDLYAELAKLHKSLGNFVKAKQCYYKAIDADKVGYEHTGYVTARAYTSLGLIALEKGNFKKAEKMLLKSTQVNRCCHIATQGMPLELAEALIERGRYEASKKYLNIVLEKFNPGSKSVLDLLRKIESEIGKK